MTSKKTMTSEPMLPRPSSLEGWQEFFSFLPNDEEDAGVSMHDHRGNRLQVSQSDLALMFHASSFQVRPDGYVSVRVDGCKKLLHRAVMRIEDAGLFVDHKSRSRADNRRSNLRPATMTENNRNGGIRKNNTSGYRGVTFSKQRQKWCAGIGLNATRVALGRFDTAIEAARAYDDAARKHYGEFASLNFPDQVS